MVFYLTASYAMASSWRPFNPGKPITSSVQGTYTLENKALKAVFQSSGDSGLKFISYDDLYSSSGIKPNYPAFTLTFTDGSKLSSDQMSQVGSPTAIEIPGNSKALSKSERLSASGYDFKLKSPQGGLSADVKIILRDNQDYVREIVTLSTGDQDSPVSSLDFGGFSNPGAKVDGTVSGSPIVDGTIYYGLEHPMSEQVVADDGTVQSKMERKLPISANSSVTYSFVIGGTPTGQLRRGFDHYVEEERARPYQPFLHYNSWYDLGYFNTYTADQCVERINTFGEQLVKMRHVKMSSYLFDDGWDDHNSVWKFGKGFPDGFTPLTEAAKKYGAAPGVWLSPWGGYGPPRETRLAFGKTQGMEEDSQGYALSGPKYFKRFLDVTTEFVTKYGINQFKFDGTGSPDKKYPGSKFDSDFDAAITLIKDLREKNPNLFINLTTGTWPSPFWLQYADSTWRGGYDHNFAGVGTKREQWITYRDGDTYNGVVEKGPLYPINSLMLHGMIYAQYADGLKTDPGNDFRNEIRSYFGTGTQLQEMYITPSLLTKQNWDDLATSAKWSWKNQNVLRDNHWVGGDPTKLEVYGWAAWSPNKSILTLRNPSDHPQAFSVDIAKILELPSGSATWFKVSPAYEDEAGYPERFDVGQSKVITLQPFQVLVMELHPEDNP